MSAFYEKEFEILIDENMPSKTLEKLYDFYLMVDNVFTKVRSDTDLDADKPSRETLALQGMNFDI